MSPTTFVPLHKINVQCFLFLPQGNPSFLLFKSWSKSYCFYGIIFVYVHIFFKEYHDITEGQNS